MQNGEGKETGKGVLGETEGNDENQLMMKKMKTSKINEGEKMNGMISLTFKWFFFVCVLFFHNIDLAMDDYRSVIHSMIQSLILIHLVILNVMLNFTHK